MTDRRFTDKPELDPRAVWSLPASHPALLENRTLFPSTVVNVDENFEDRLLVSGENNRKLGKTITKGNFKGYALYGLSLEERATCPTDCGERAFCYGNGMQMARRHRIGDLDLFCTHLEDEIRTILADPIDGLMVRLHVLGDFPSIEYVAFWADMLAEHPKLACYGYTHRLPKGIGGDEIGEAIESVKSNYRERFRIRWSWKKALADGAFVVDHVPEGKTITGAGADAIVCPAQTDATACCASCGFCWEWSASGKAIAFIKHGPKSEEARAALTVEEQEQAAPAGEGEAVRPIAALKFPQKRDIVLSQPPEMRLVAPTALRVEPAYQRDLSGKSMALIRKIVIGWDWAKFKPPVCAETADGLFIIDGQHTAIAAASHPEIKEIPVMVVPADRLERRAEAFVSHNRDRLVMSSFQIFHAELAAGSRDAKAIISIAGKAGAIIPRSAPLKGYAKPGQIIALSEVARIFKADGPDTLERVLRIAVAARLTPIGNTVTRGLRLICREPAFSETARMPDSRIANAVKSIKNIDQEARAFALTSEQSRDRACAVLISQACKVTA